MLLHVNHDNFSVLACYVACLLPVPDRSGSVKSRLINLSGYRIDFKIALLTYKCLNNLAPEYLKELVVPRKQSVKSVRLDDDYFILDYPACPNYLITKLLLTARQKYLIHCPIISDLLSQCYCLRVNLKHIFFSLAFGI